jgi:exonuclease III
VIGFIFVVLIIFFVNAFYKPSAVRLYQWSSEESISKNDLKIITWNLGYGGLGKESNFVMDGGTDWRPELKTIVEKNVSGIIDFLKSTNPDLFLFQEIAKPSFMNHRVNVLDLVVTALSKYQHIYISDFQTYLIPAPFSINSGLSVFAKSGLVVFSESRLLPLEPRRSGAFRKRYQAVANHISTNIQDKEWIIINLHLAAFDFNGDIRNKQLAKIRSFAIEQYERGNFVIIGGDWNLRLDKTDFPHKTEQKYLFWVHDLPDDAFPPDWKIVADPRVPSVRTVHKAYVPNDNYVTIIDGFITSPNVNAIMVQTMNLGFAYSDHNPVKASFTTMNTIN